MSKARSMYAGSSGSNYSVNKNSPGNGNHKWQGLPPTVGHARNARHINIEAGGNNRNVVFCMNQLGGVGRISNMFATTADGVKEPCPGADNKPWWYNNKDIIDALTILRSYVKSTYGNNVDIAFAGVHESLALDSISGQSGYNSALPEWFFKPLNPNLTLSSQINDAIKLLNKMNIVRYVNSADEQHVISIVGNSAHNALRNVEPYPYGERIYLSANIYLWAYGNSPYCCFGADVCMGFTAGESLLNNDVSETCYSWGQTKQNLQACPYSAKLPDGSYKQKKDCVRCETEQQCAIM